MKFLKKGQQPLPPPLVKPWRHPFKWTRQKLALLIAAGFGAHIGTLIIVALYYLVLGAPWTPLKHTWHVIVANSELRHMFRGVGEGLLGGVLGQMLIWNAYKKIKPIKWYDKLEIKLRIPNIKDSRRLSIWQMAATPFVIILYALPGFWVAWFALKGVHTHLDHTHSAIAHSYWQKIQGIWTSEKDQKLVGIFASFFLGRRPVKKVANDVQLWFAIRRRSLSKPLRWYHTPVFKARYNGLTDSDIRDTTIKHHGLQATLMVWSVVVGFALAGYGYYVLTEIAN